MCEVRVAPRWGLKAASVQGRSLVSDHDEPPPKLFFSHDFFVIFSPAWVTRACAMPPKAKKKKRLPRDTASLAARGKAKAAIEHTYSKAVAWCLEKNCGAQRAVKSGLFEGITRSTLKRRLEKHDSDDPERSKRNAILTPREERDLVEWLVAKNREHAGVGRSGAATKIVEILEARQAMRRLNFQKKYDPLSKSALTALKNGGPSTCPLFPPRPPYQPPNPRFM